MLARSVVYTHQFCYRTRGSWAWHGLLASHCANCFRNSQIACKTELKPLCLCSFHCSTYPDFFQRTQQTPLPAAMANVRQGFDTSPLDAYYAVPPITRWLATTVAAVSTLANFKLISPHFLYLNWSLILKLQVWRLITPFLFLGRFSFNFLIQLIWLVTYGRTLETSTFQFSTPDFVYMIMFGMTCMLAASLLPFFSFPFLASPIIFMLIYVWSRNFPTGNVSIMGLVQIQAFYVPFAFLGISLISGNNWMSDLLGILTGHLYYTLKVLMPAQGRQCLLETPDIVKRLCYRYGIGTVNAQEVNPTNPAQPTFAAFRGRRQRLGG